MPKLRIPKYRHHKARNLAVVKIDGKDCYLGLYDSPESRAEYERLVSAWLVRQHETPAARANISVCELMAAYLVFARAYYVKNEKPTREFGCISESLREVRKLHEQTMISDFGPRALKEIRNRMIELGWSRKYINKQVGRIVRMVKWGVSEELVSPSVHQALTTVTGLRKGRTTAPEHKPIKPVPDEDIEKTLPLLSPVIADMIRLQRFSGARPGEVVMLRPRDLDRSSSVWVYRPDSHKTEHHERDRVIFLGPRAQDIIRKYLDRGVEEYCFSPQESEQQRRAELHRQRTTPLHYGNRPKPKSPDGRRRPKECYTTDSYRRAIHRACKRTGISKWSPNQIRHTTGTEVRRKRGLEAAQTVLGHATADVTQIYAERDMELAASVALELG